MKILLFFYGLTIALYNTTLIVFMYTEYAGQNKMYNYNMLMEVSFYFSCTINQQWTQ